MSRVEFSVSMVEFSVSRVEISDSRVEIRPLQGRSGHDQGVDQRHQSRIRSVVRALRDVQVSYQCMIVNDQKHNRNIMVDVLLLFGNSTNVKCWDSDDGLLWVCDSEQYIVHTQTR